MNPPRSWSRPAARCACTLASIIAPLLALAGCPGSGGSGPDPLPEPEAVIVDPGSGPTSDRPIVSMSAGTRLVRADGLEHVIVGRVTLGGVELVQDQWSEGTTNYWRSTEQGWFLAWTDAGPVARPVLVYPHAIRVGMIWESGGIRFEVGARQEAYPTRFGPRTAWTVAMTGPAITPQALVWAEGVGEVERYDTVGGGDRSLVSGVVTAGAPEATDPETEAVPLTPLPVLGDEDGVLHAEADQIGLVDGGDGQPLLLVVGPEWVAQSGQWIESRAELCGRMQDSGIDLAVETTTEIWTPEAVYGYEGVACPKLDFDLLADPSTIWIDAQGMAYYFDKNRAPVGVRHLRETVAPPGADVPWQLAAAVTGWQLLTWDDLADPQFNVIGENHGAYHERALLADWLAPVAGDQLTPPVLLSPRHPLIRRDPSGLVVEQWLEDGALAGAGVTAHLGAVHPWVRHGERGWLATYPDGRVDRVEMSADGVSVRRVARLALPAGQALRAAVPVERDGEARLLVVTSDRAFAPDLDGRPYAFVSHFHTAPLPPEPGPRETTPALTIRYGASGLDAQVCWRPVPGEPLALAGWTLGGAPAADVRAHDPGCALIVRDLEAAGDPAEPGGTLVTGTLPGVGAVEIALPLGTEPLGITTQDLGQLVPVEAQVLATGGLVGDHWHWGAGGWRVGPAASTGYPFRYGYPDLQARGAWGSRDVVAYRWTMELDDGFSVVTADASWASDGQLHVVGNAADGGVVVVEQAAGGYLWHVGPDGHATDLGLGYERVSGATVLEDGTVCVVGTLGLVPYLCRDAGGTVREPEPPTELPAWSDGLYLLPDGAIFLPGFREYTTPPGALLDPVALTHTDLGEVSTREHRYRPGGRLYAVTVSREPTDPAEQVVEVTSTGLRPFPLPDYHRLTGYDQEIATVLPERDHLLVVLRDGRFLRLVYPD